MSEHCWVAGLLSHYGARQNVSRPFVHENRPVIVYRRKVAGTLQVPSGRVVVAGYYILFDCLHMIGRWVVINKRSL